MPTTLREADLGRDQALLLAGVRAQTRLTMSDACVLATALDRQLLTFDVQLADAARERALLFAD